MTKTVYVSVSLVNVYALFYFCRLIIFFVSLQVEAVHHFLPEKRKEHERNEDVHDREQAEEEEQEHHAVGKACQVLGGDDEKAEKGAVICVAIVASFVAAHVDDSSVVTVASPCGATVGTITV